jgi:hypothetical protein
MLMLLAALLLPLAGPTANLAALAAVIPVQLLATAGQARQQPTQTGHLKNLTGLMRQQPLQQQRQQQLHL